MNKAQILYQKIQEILSHSYEFEHHSESPRYHQYDFHTDKGNKYSVGIHHGYNSDGSNHAEVSFFDHEDGVRVNNAERSSAHKVLGTVAKIVKHHSEKFPNIDPYHFSGDEEHQGVYRAMAKRMAHKHSEHPEMFDYGDKISHGTHFTVNKSDLK